MNKIKKAWLDFFEFDANEDNWWQQKKKLWENRNASIVRINGEGEVYREMRLENEIYYEYLLYLSFLIKQKDVFFLEEQVIPYGFRFVDGKMVDHKMMANSRQEETIPMENEDQRTADASDETRFTYDRRRAVQYAESWWNSYNPAYRTFEVDCTNYVSQCMHAGGAPMRGGPNREEGWWYTDTNWSFSWAVAHSLRWYLAGSEAGLMAREVEQPEELGPGDVICYDFEGDGRWDHNTIVVANDMYGAPLVNAHTTNSRQRFWSYTDSSAWTPNIQYKFFRIDG